MVFIDVFDIIFREPVFLHFTYRIICFKKIIFHQALCSLHVPSFQLCYVLWKILYYDYGESFIVLLDIATALYYSNDERVLMLPLIFAGI